MLTVLSLGLKALPSHAVIDTRGAGRTELIFSVSDEKSYSGFVDKLDKVLDGRCYLARYIHTCIYYISYSICIIQYKEIFFSCSSKLFMFNIAK